MNRWCVGFTVLSLGWSAAHAQSPITLGRPVLTDPPPAADEPAVSFGTPVAVPAVNEPAAGLARPVVRAQNAGPSRPDAKKSSLVIDDPLFCIATAVDPAPAALGSVAGPSAVPAGPPLASAIEERYNSGVVTDPLGVPSDRPELPPTSIERSVSAKGWVGNAWDDVTRPCDPCGQHRGSFQSDHAFDYMISPVTNPFYAEDPRALTEVRPIFLYQKIPSSHPFYGGGNIFFFGAQGRVAFTERLSLTIHKLGGMSVSPDNDFVSSETGFTEVWLGPKYTFLRSEETCTVAAAGLQFQLPVGSSELFQDRGNLSLVPYATISQNFFRTTWGSFNVMDTFAYSFGTNSDRNDYFTNTLHLDYDVANLHRIYPLLELNWWYYTKNGNGPNIGLLGYDLMNTGSPTAKSNSLFTLAGGLRYKFTEQTQFGVAAEFPLNGDRDIFDYRVTFDLIFRY